MSCPLPVLHTGELTQEHPDTGCQNLNLVCNLRCSHEDVRRAACIFQAIHVLQKEVKIPHSRSVMRALDTFW